MAYRGYHFFIDDLELPYAPSKLKITTGSKNKTVDLISGGEINIPKSPKLTEIEFDIELPRGRQYAFANTLVSSKVYTDHFEKLMVTKTPARLVITRPNPFLDGATGIGGTIKDFESTVLSATLEGYKMEEDADNAYDIKVSLKFRQYDQYGTVSETIPNNSNPSNPNKQPVSNPTKPVVKNETYTVKSGDTLWNISKKFYGTSDKWKTIYDANKTLIEKTAQKHGRKSSSNGHYIYPGTKLIIPATSKK